MALPAARFLRLTPSGHLCFHAKAVHTQRMTHAHDKHHPHPASTKTEPRRIAIIGLGVMGGPIARHLGNAGHTLTLFNRSPERIDKWRAVHPMW